MKKVHYLFVVFLFFISSCSSGGIFPEGLGNSIDGWICFESGKDIWIMRSDDNELQNLTNTESLWETSCKLSWDSKKILYIDRDGALYSINRNGTDKSTHLTENVMEPTWAPDGTKISYVQMSSIDGVPIMSINLLDIETSKSVKIFESNFVQNPVISPDGNKIAYSSDKIFLINIDGSDLMQIYTPIKNEMVSQIAWSKNGQKIAFSTSNGVSYGAESWAEYSEIYVMNSDGSELVNLTNSAPDSSITLNAGKNIFKIADFPCWTNGDELVFLSNMDSHNYTVKPYSMNLEDESVKLLIDQDMNGMDFQPDISKNSTPVPIMDISEVVLRSDLNATATAAVELAIFEATATALSKTSECINSIYLPIETNWRIQVCENFNSDEGLWSINNIENDYLIRTKSVKNGYYQWDITATRGAFSPTTPLFPTNYDKFIVTTTASIDGSNSAGFAIIFRVDGYNKYVFVVYPSKSTYFLGYYNEDQWTTLKKDTFSEIYQDDPNQLTILAQETFYEVYINDNFVYAFNDETLKSGEIGLGVDMEANEEATFYFDNFMLLTP